MDDSPVPLGHDELVVLRLMAEGHTVEATALGNVLVHARSLGAVSGDLDDLRALIARTHELVTYRPRSAPGRAG